MLNQAKQNAAEYIRQNADVFQSVSDYIWQNPELSLQEFKATQRFCAELRNEGFTVTENLCGIPTAFCGRNNIIFNFFGITNAVHTVTSLG